MSQPPPVPASALAARCPQCGTAIPPAALSCPACHALVHADRLKQLAETARAAASAGDVSAQLEAWRIALTSCCRPDSSAASFDRRARQGLSRSPSSDPRRCRPPA
jgi:hypothetical protein